MDQKTFIELQAIANLVQSLATVLAILIGGVWGYKLFRLKRQKYPRADIDHQIIEVHLSKDKSLIKLIVTISNRGDVLIPLKSGNVVISKIFPLPQDLPRLLKVDKDTIEARHLIESFREAISGEEKYKWETEIPWPVIDSYSTKWKKGEKEIEPGDSLQLRYDFLIDKDIRTIMIYCFYEDIAKQKLAWQFWRKQHVGWDWLTISELSAEPSTQEARVNLPTRPNLTDSKHPRRKSRQ